ncbi:MAG TPA: hypothetical protein VFX78_04265, partial [Candidatus Eisenbacteria bacterium]|nr:hypothetical protein [Candidatus Eisenbacteria bacterium]
MTDPVSLTAIPEINKSIVDRFIIEPLFTFLQRRSPRTRGILLVIVSTLLVASAFWAMLTLNAYTHFMASTLAQRLEPTEQPYKGLEAYLLSGIPGGARNRWDKPSGEDKILALQEYFDNRSSNDLRRLPINRFHVNNPSVLSTRDQYITIGEPSAFLFQPSFLLQPV